MKNKTILSFSLALGLVFTSIGISLLVDKKSNELLTSKEPEQEDSSPSTEEERDKWNISNARELLKPDTLQWSAKLPVPKSTYEDYLLLYLQIAYDKDDVDVVKIAHPSINKFMLLKNDKSFNSFLDECFKSKVILKEERVSKFLSDYGAMIK